LPFSQIAAAIKVDNIAAFVGYGFRLLNTENDHGIARDYDIGNRRKSKANDFFVY